MPPLAFPLDTVSNDEPAEHSESEFEKDASEEELERLVFGDTSGFADEIKNLSSRNEIWSRRRSVSEDSALDGRELEHVDDADLFFLDEGPTEKATPGHTSAVAAAGSADRSHPDGPPAWSDSDDERITVSLASVPRLRKLRIGEDEDLVNGKEYSRRLRTQFTRLYPVPEWAVHARGHVRKRRRRDSQSSHSDQSDADSDVMDIDGVQRVQPLTELLQHADSLVASRSHRKTTTRDLRAEVLDIQRTKDVENRRPFALTSLSFHPTLPLLLSSGTSSTLQLHHIDPSAPEPNPLLISVHIKHTPLTTSAFHPSANDSRIFLGAQRRYFHIWNLDEGVIEKVTRVYGHQQEQRSMDHLSISPDGSYIGLKGSSRKGSGVVNILDAATFQWVAQARVESRGGVADFAWWGDSSGMSIAGKNGEVTEWSLTGQRAVVRWTDEGSVGTSVVALGGKIDRKAGLGNDRWIAVGSSSGVVNIYDRAKWVAGASDGRAGTGITGRAGVPERPKPTRVLDQLTTAISHLVFSSDGQLLAISSRWKRDALRLVHLPSCTVYRNWPTSSTPLGRITAVAWGNLHTDSGPSDLLLAVANEQGKIRLWEVRG